MNDNITIRPPADEQEIRQLWALNHEIFSRELRQHEIHEDGCLVDKFHHKNYYIAAWNGQKAVGMVCAHAKPPFSAVEKFGEVMARAILPGKTAEIRLLAVRPEYRHTLLVPKMGARIFTYLAEQGIELLVISGVSSQKSFYEHVGFHAIGEPVQNGAAWFYPMTARLQDVLDWSSNIINRCRQ